MDQKQLRELEYRCIQEEPPWCTAACPIHVDARAFIRQLREGEWDAARKTLARTMPFVGILGRICDHPCELECKRGEAGGAIAIGALERACVQASSSAQRIQMLPSKTQRAAVVGGDLSGLTVAWDLARKGYELTLFAAEDRLGARLRGLPDSLLPESVIDEETGLLVKLGVQIDLSHSVDMQMLDDLSKGFDAVYIGMDGLSRELFGQAAGDEWLAAIDNKTRATGREGIFAGGAWKTEGRRSFIGDVAEGRSAAVSIDRFLQKVSLTAAREKEGPHATRLFTSLEGIEALPVTTMADPVSGYTQQEAAVEARRCLQCECLECVKICPYLEHYKAYPKRYAREIYNNESIVMGEHRANTLINSCSLCRLCEIVCPNDFSMADLCHQVRTSMVQRGKMPPSAHEFALRDMAFSNSEHFLLARHQPGCERSAAVFFPGCQLSASLPGHVKRVYRHLCDKLPGGIGLMLRCCGAPAYWGGESDLFQQTLREFQEAWRCLGSPQLIVACSGCQRMFRDHLQEVPVVSLWKVLDEAEEKDRESRSPQDMRRSSIAILDPCTARDDKTVQQAVRRLLKRRGFAVEELRTSGYYTECCGYGGLMSNASPVVAKKVVRRRAQQSSRDFVAYCAMCRDNLAGVEKPTLHLLDVWWGETGGQERAREKGPGFSQRHENRARLKQHLLSECWGEISESTMELENIELVVKPEVQERLDERRILLEDVRRVIDHADKTGDKFRNPKTGHWLASFRPTRVTYWVEYIALADGFEIKNAYAHRMEVLRRTGS